MVPKRKKIAMYAAMIIITAIVVFPFLWMVYFIEIKDIGLDCFFAGIVDGWLGSDVGNAVVNFVFPVDFRNIHTIWRQ